MTKYAAYQVAPENQQSPLLLIDEFFPDNISVFGNREYQRRYSKEVKDIMKSLKDNDLDWKLNCTENVNEERDVLEDWFTDAKKLDDEKIHRLAGLVRGDVAYKYRQDVYCGIFSILTGKQYDFQCIRGCCQSDWNYVYYVHDEWTDIEIDKFCTEYFNTGTEWMIYEEEDVDSPVYYYTHYWDVDLSRDELAEMIGCKPEEIQMFEFAGYVKTPKYTEVVF